MAWKSSRCFKQKYTKEDLDDLKNGGVTIIPAPPKEIVITFSDDTKEFLNELVTRLVKRSY